MERLAAEGKGANPLAPKAPPLPGTAKRVIHIFSQGGPSHIDIWDWWYYTNRLLKTDYAVDDFEVAKRRRIYEERVGEGVQGALNKQFENYNLRGQTWADLTRSRDPVE